MPGINRRSFLGRSAGVGAAAFATPLFTAALAAAAPGRPPRLEALTSAWLPRREVMHWPAVSNFWGAVGTGGNVLAIRNFTLAPYLDDGGDSCVLSVDGVPVPADAVRWSAYEITRKGGTASGVEVRTATRLAFERNTLLLRITVVNPTDAAAVVSVDANARIARGAMPATWAWDPPRPGDDHTFTTHQVRDDLVISDSRSSAVTVFAFSSGPALAVGPNGGSARWSVAAGRSVTIDIVMEVGRTSTGGPLAGIADARETLAAGRATIRGFEAAFHTAAEEWRSRWREAFTPGNRHYSGSLPVLRTDDADIARLYYMAVLSVLVCERTNLSPRFSDVLGRPAGGFRGLDRVYVTGSPEWAATVSYFWDTSYCSVVLALLDPQMMKAKTAYWISQDIYAGYAIDWVSGRTVGPWYSANDLSVFTTTLNYVNHSGDLAFLGTAVPGTGRTVQEHLRSIATHWETLVPQGQSLADYGENHNLLEVLPKYTHQVASFNAGNVWMMQQAAELCRRTGDEAAADDLDGRADDLRQEVLALYDPGNGGVWNCRDNDGATVAVRTVLDFALAGRLLAPALTEAQKAGMKRFAATELLVGDWMRALSLSDSQAPVSRTDHGTTGAYDSWPALTAQTFARFGDYPALLAQLRSFAGVTAQGPFSQSHQLLQLAGVSVADRPALNPTGAMTVSAWVSPSRWPTEVWQGSIVTKDSWGGRDSGYALRGGAGGEISFVLALDGRFTEVRTSVVVPATGWHHVAGVYDGEQMQIYVDGAPRAARSVTGTPTPSSGTPLVTGNCPSDPSRRFTGSIDEARVHARALSDAEIHALYAATTSPTGAGDSSLVLRLPFDEGQGTTTTEAVTDQECAIEGATWAGGREGLGAALAFSEQAASPHAVIASPGGLQCFNNLAGGAFADVIITDLFGYTPEGTTAGLRDAAVPRGITATLSGVVFDGRRHTITSGPEGLSLT